MIPMKSIDSSLFKISAFRIMSVPEQDWHYEIVADQEQTCDYTNEAIYRGDKFITVQFQHGLIEHTYSQPVCEQIFDPLMDLFSKYSLQQIAELHAALQEHLAPAARVPGQYHVNAQ